MHQIPGELAQQQPHKEEEEDPFGGGEHLRGFTLNHGPIKELGDHDGG